MLSFSLTNLPLSMYVVDDLPRRYFASRQIPLPLIFTGNGACRPRPRRKPEMNYCSTVICSLFRLPACLFAPVPASVGVRLRWKPEMNFCSTVICSLFRLLARLFAPVPASVGVRLRWKSEMNFCSTEFFTD